MTHMKPGQSEVDRFLDLYIDDPLKRMSAKTLLMSWKLENVQTLQQILLSYRGEQLVEISSLIENMQELLDIKS